MTYLDKASRGGYVYQDSARWAGHLRATQTTSPEIKNEIPRLLAVTSEPVDLEVKKKEGDQMLFQVGQGLKLGACLVVLDDITRASEATQPRYHTFILSRLQSISSLIICCANSMLPP